MSSAVSKVAADVADGRRGLEAGSSGSSCWGAAEEEASPGARLSIREGARLGRFLSRLCWPVQAQISPPKPQTLQMESAWRRRG